MCHFLIAISLLALAVSAPSQTPPPPPSAASPSATPAQTPPARRPTVISPDIQADRTVTFRLLAPDAQTVKVSGDWSQEYDLTKGENGVWSITVGPLEPDLFGYSFQVDGVTILDPQNPSVKPSRSVNTSALEIPGANLVVPLDYDPKIAHGTVHLHDYESPSLCRTRRLRVYTPPNFDPKSATPFPILYLLHGAGDNEAVWTEFGRANLILDNLIAAGRAVPMIVVMPDGHALVGYSPEARSQNAAAFERDLLESVVPFVQACYPIDPDREKHAIAGLSMGGNQAVLIGLNHRDLFAWVAGMSSAIREPEAPLASSWSDPVSAKTPLRLLWLSIGRDDFLLKENRAFDALLTERKVPHEYRETDGSHRWMVWRRNLTELAPRLFSQK